MTQESTSNKLSELFDLYKSGALTKEEYESLKAKIINISEIRQPEEAETVQVTASNLVNENSHQKDDEKTVEFVSATPQKKKFSRPIIITTCSLIIVVTAIFLFTRRNSTPDIKSENTLPVIINNTLPVVETKKNDWDETAATKTVIDELSKHSDWSSMSYRDSTQLIHKIVRFTKINLDTQDLMVGITFSNYENNECRDCSGLLSIFEFANNDGWRLTRKSIAFANGGSSGSLPNKLDFYKISTNNYGLLKESISGTQGEVNESRNLYAFVNNEFISILSLSHMGDSEHPYKSDLNFITKSDGYYDIESIDKETPVDGNETIETTIYKFNGVEYVKE